MTDQPTPGQDPVPVSGLVVRHADGTCAVVPEAVVRSFAVRSEVAGPTAEAASECDWAVVGSLDVLWEKAAQIVGDDHPAGICVYVGRTVDPGTANPLGYIDIPLPGPALPPAPPSPPTS